MPILLIHLQTDSDDFWSVLSMTITLMNSLNGSRNTRAAAVNLSLYFLSNDLRTRACTGQSFTTDVEQNQH